MCILNNFRGAKNYSYKHKLINQGRNCMKHINVKHVNNKYYDVSRLGSLHNLSFSSQLVIGDIIIALDGGKKTLLIVDTNPGVNKSDIIDLNDVSSVTVKRSYKGIDAEE